MSNYLFIWVKQSGAIDFLIQVNNFLLIDLLVFITLIQIYLLIDEETFFRIKVAFITSRHTADFM